MAVLCAVWALAAGASADAQQDLPEPLPPPETAPQSRLTVTPSDFERWLSRVPQPDGDRAIHAEPSPTLTAPPPPPPTLVAPPPPPILAAPPATSGRTPSVPQAPNLTEPPVRGEPVTLPPESATTPASPKPVPGHGALPEDIRIAYPPDATDVPAAARDRLDGLAAWLGANPSVRVQVEAYASEVSAAVGQARRLSLLRAREVRRYLMEQGVPETQIDVRALGAETEVTPRDRVEIKLPRQ